MARISKKIIKVVTEPSQELKEFIEQNNLERKNIVQSITHEFGNGDMNIIRDKVNEIIKHLS